MRTAYKTTPEMPLPEDPDQCGKLLKHSNRNAATFDILLACHEDQDVAWSLSDVDLERLLHCSIDVIERRLLRKYYLTKASIYRPYRHTKDTTIAAVLNAFSTIVRFSN